MWDDLTLNKPAIASMLKKDSDFQRIASSFGEGCELSIPMEHISVEIRKKLPATSIYKDKKITVNVKTNDAYVPWEY